MLEAFFRGAELTGAKPADPIGMMNDLGKAFRAIGDNAADGLRRVLNPA